VKRFALVLVSILSAGLAAPAVGAAPVTLRLNGIGPLKLGMTRAAAVSTGWLAHRGTGCELGGKPFPVTYRLSGAKAPNGVSGTAQFVQGRLQVLSFSKGARTRAGVAVGQTTTGRMVNAYRQAGFSASARFDPVFGGTFVTVKRHARNVIMGFAQHGVVISLGIPFIPVCD
jgi:hypothetical protein